jgi:hypothetical protein
MEAVIDALHEAFARTYDLADMLARIDVLFAEGRMTEAMRTALIEEARANAKPEASYAPTDERLLALETALRALETRVEALERCGTSAQGGEEGGADSILWPEWVQPLGAHDAYAIGAKVLFGGKVWESTIDNNVWSPAVYPAGWKEVA